MFLPEELTSVQGFAVHQFAEPGGGVYRGGFILDVISPIEIAVSKLNRLEEMYLGNEADTNRAEHDGGTPKPQPTENGRAVVPARRKRGGAAPPKD
jgi:hypothetical protein